MKEGRGSYHDIVFVQPEILGGGNGRGTSCLVTDEHGFRKSCCSPGQGNCERIIFIQRNGRRARRLAADELVHVHGITRSDLLLIRPVEQDQPDRLVEFRQDGCDHRRETRFKKQNFGFDLVQHIDQFIGAASRRTMSRYIRRPGNGKVCDRIFRAIAGYDCHLRALF